MFDFEKIEDKSIHNPIVPILIKNTISNKEAKVCNIDFHIIHQLCLKYKLKNIEDIKKELISVSIKLSKKDKIKFNNSLLKFNIFFNNVIEDKYIITSIYEYIIETILIIAKIIKKNRLYCLKLGFSYQYLFKKYNLHIFKILYQRLFSFIKNSNQLDIMNKFPELFHSKNLISILEDPLEPFKHQKEFIDTIKNKKCSKPKIIINASPISSGKTILQPATIMCNKFQEKKIILITCLNIVVLETVAQACNNENNIAYWFMYENRLVPSYFCQPKRKKSRFTSNVSKPPFKELDLQYDYYVQEYFKILNDKSYIKNFNLPDVIFAVPEQALKLLQNKKMNALINQVVIDEFLIPHFNILPLLKFCKNSDVILLSASAPNKKEIFMKKHKEIVEELNDFDLHYIYQPIIPSFIYCTDLDDKPWLPTMELNIENFNEKIDLFNWYHFRFYPPHILFKMKEKINKILNKEKYEIDLSLQYKDINDLMLESQNFLLSLKQESDEIKNIICHFNIELPIKKKQLPTMIIHSNPIECLTVYSNIHIEDIIQNYLSKKEKVEIEKNNIRRELESLEKISLKNECVKFEHYENKNKLEKELYELEANIDISIENGLNTINYEKCIEIKKYLESQYPKEQANNIIINLFFGNIIYDIKGCYYKFISRNNFKLNHLFVSPIMAYGTDMNIYSVKVLENIDEITLVQAFGRAGRTRNDIYVPVSAPLESLKKLLIL